MTNFKQLCERLENKIVNSYEQGISLEDAEKLAGEFLFAMFAVSTELKNASLNSRMRKAGVKAVRAAIYLDIAQKADKKPTEAAITAMLDSDTIIRLEQKSYDEAEVDSEELERLYSIFQNAHIHFRALARGSFGG